MQTNSPSTRARWQKTTTNQIMSSRCLFVIISECSNEQTCSNTVINHFSKYPGSHRFHHCSDPRGSGASRLYVNYTGRVKIHLFCIYAFLRGVCMYLSMSAEIKSLFISKTERMVNSSFDYITKSKGITRFAELICGLLVDKGESLSHA